MKRTYALILSTVIICLIFSACGSTPASDIESQPPSSTPTENVTTQAGIIPENDTLDEPEPSDDEGEESNIVISNPDIPTSEAASEPEPFAAPSPTSTNLPTQTPVLPPTSVPTVTASEQSPTLTPTTTSSPTPSSTPEEQESDEPTNITVTIGSSVFAVILYDNDAAEAFIEKLPMTVDMSELNGNEKYFYLPDSLPTDSERVGSIHAGDLMLYGSDCLVLFYESFATSYSYTKLGYIEDVSGLAAALGSGGVKVTFAVSD